MNQKNNNHLVVITGAGRGIGKKIATELGHDGYSILCISQSENAQLTSDEINLNSGKSDYLELDIKEYEALEKKISDWINKKSFEKISIILAAGILGQNSPFIENQIKSWEETFQINVLGNLAVLKSFLPTILKLKFGRIVFFSGGGAAYANPDFPAYAASKTAIVRISENLHEEFKNSGNISVVCLAPGAVETDMLKQRIKAGDQINNLTDIMEAVNFVKAFIESKNNNLSGRFIHVKNDWKKYLAEDFKSESMWKLRRIE